MIGSCLKPLMIIFPEILGEMLILQWFFFLRFYLLTSESEQGGGGEAEVEGEGEGVPSTLPAEHRA